MGIAEHGVPPSTFGRQCHVCGEPFGMQCFGFVVTVDVAAILEPDATDMRCREVCNRCKEYYCSAHFWRGSYSWVHLRCGCPRLALKCLWKHFWWYWPRRHVFDSLGMKL